MTSKRDSKSSHLRLGMPSVEVFVWQVSPDRGLRQSSTVADSMCYRFSSDKSVERFIAGSYLEFAERLPLPEFSHLPVRQFIPLLPVVI